MGDCDEQLIAHKMSETVVHHLEPIQIKEEHREERIFVTKIPSHGELQVIDKQGAVRQSG